MSKKLKALGVSKKTNTGLYRFDKPDVSLLETFKHLKHERHSFRPFGQTAVQTICIDCPEFTSVCPVTGQPDFGHIIITYIPKVLCVESKALKLYLMGYRNHGAFHEACVTQICEDLIRTLDPIWLQVKGNFMPRGGISINPISTYGTRPN